MKNDLFTEKNKNIFITLNIYIFKIINNIIYCFIFNKYNMHKTHSLRVKIRGEILCNNNYTKII